MSEGLTNRAERDDHASPAERLTSLLERSFSDPAMVAVIDKARLWTEALQLPAYRDVNKKEIQDELDTDWEPWMNKALTASGPVTLESHGVKEVFNIIGQKVVSNGFIVINPAKDDSETGPARFAHAMTIQRSALGDGLQDASTVVVRAELDTMVFQTDSASLERATAWLQLWHPELLAEIDRKIDSATTVEGQLFALKSVSFDSISVDYNKKPELDDPFNRNCLETYISSRIKMDTEAQYAMGIKGRVAAFDETGQLQQEQMADLKLVVFEKFAMTVFKEGPNDDRNRKLTLQVTTRPEGNEPRKLYIVPVNSIDSLFSLKDDFYARLKSAQAEGRTSL